MDLQTNFVTQPFRRYLTQNITKLRHIFILAYRCKNVAHFFLKKF